MQLLLSGKCIWNVVCRLVATLFMPPCISNMLLQPKKFHSQSHPIFLNHKTKWKHICYLIIRIPLLNMISIIEITISPLTLLTNLSNDIPLSLYFHFGISTNNFVVVSHPVVYLMSEIKFQLQKCRSYWNPHCAVDLSPWIHPARNFQHQETPLSEATISMNQWKSNSSMWAMELFLLHIYHQYMIKHILWFIS